MMAWLRGLYASAKARLAARPDTEHEQAIVRLVVAAALGAYLLPGIKRDFEIKRAEGNIPGGKARLSVTLVDGSKQSYDVTIPNMRPPA